MLVGVGSFFLGVILTVGVIFFTQTSQSGSSILPLRASTLAKSPSDYKFIDPLVGTRGINDLPKYHDMETQVASFVADQKQHGLTIASVDFRDINEPGGFKLNQNEQYTPASLNKVPMMIAYYKISETNPSILSKEITYTGAKDSNDVEEVKSTVQLTPGARYTVEQLIEHMIRYSDNNAVDLLAQNLTDTNNINAYVSTFTDLGLDPKVITDYQDNVTVSQYSMFLRALYNATYLNRADSERALKLLTETDFTAGIESGVPNDILVAQKFGEVKVADASGSQTGKEIHNCGIVYYPDHPYLLCIMTKGTGDDVKGLENDLASISTIVYKGMQKIYPEKNY